MDRQKVILAYIASREHILALVKKDKSLVSIIRNQASSTYSNNRTREEYSYSPPVAKVRRELWLLSMVAMLIIV